MMVERLGDGALRMPRPPGHPDAILAAARAWPGVVDAVLTEVWLVVHFADDAEPAAHPFDVLAASTTPARTHDIQVTYDGADLDDVATACGISRARVIELHSRANYTVRFVGFMPGFAYLGGLPPELEVARLPSPRTRIPKNAVAIAGPYSGIYPFEGPGGWRLLGTADVVLFDLERGALLRTGDHVRFVPR